MMIGPAPMMRMVWRSERFGMVSSESGGRQAGGLRVAEARLREGEVEHARRLRRCEITRLGHQADETRPVSGRGVHRSQAAFEEARLGGELRAPRLQPRERGLQAAFLRVDAG